MCRRGYRIINYKGKPTVKELNKLFYWANHLIGHRQSCIQTKFDKFDSITRHRLGQICNIHLFIQALMNDPKQHKGDIQALGGPKFPEIFRRGLVGFKGFLVGVRRDVLIYLQQWTIAFGPSGRGVISWDGDLRGANCCWWCGANIVHSLEVLEFGFAPPWCSGVSCPSRDDKRASIFRTYVHRYNNSRVPPLVPTSGETAGTTVHTVIQAPVVKDQDSSRTRTLMQAVDDTTVCGTTAGGTTCGTTDVPRPAEARTSNQSELMVRPRSNPWPHTIDFGAEYSIFLGIYVQIFMLIIVCLLVF